MGMAKRIRMQNKGNSFRMRCQLCLRPVSEIYRVQFSEGGPFYMLCSSQCVTRAQSNYNRKLKQGLLPKQEQEEQQFTDTMTFSDEDNIEKE